MEDEASADTRLTCDQCNLSPSGPNPQRYGSGTVLSLSVWVIEIPVSR